MTEILNGRSRLLVNENGYVGYYKYSKGVRFAYFLLILIGAIGGTWCLWDTVASVQNGMIFTFTDLMACIGMYVVPIGLAKPLALDMGGINFYAIYVKEGEIHHEVFSHDLLYRGR